MKVSNPACPRPLAACLHSIPRLAAIMLWCLAPSVVSAEQTWPTVPPAELADTKPLIDPEAGAEVLEWRIDIDDVEYPRERRVSEYIRYKIYAPEKAEEVTRLSSHDVSAETRRVALRARLTLANGTVKEFGQEAVKERELARRAGTGIFGSEATAKERFLAVPGVEPGSVLEYRVTRTELEPGFVYAVTMQRKNVPVRLVNVRCRLSPMATDNKTSPDMDSSVFVLNQVNGEMKRDTNNDTMVFTATNVPTVRDEPMLGPVSDYMMTLVISYEPRHIALIGRSEHVPAPGNVEAKLGPWAMYSTSMNWFDRDRAYLTPRTKKLAAQLTASAPDDLAKARAIHAYVRDAVQRHLRMPRRKVSDPLEPASLDEVMDFEKNPRLKVTNLDLHFLALGLYKAAGLQCSSIMLPDREVMRFDPKLVMRGFLADRAIALQIGNQWYFSCVHSRAPLPFGLLPWQLEGQMGLLALGYEQRFIKVPPTPAARSVITSTGTFTLDADGTLSGDCKRTFTGQTAVALRDELLNTDADRREYVGRDRFGLDAKVVELTDFTFEGVDDPEQPLVIKAKLRWPGFAARTKDRLIVRAVVFRAEDTPMFPAAERRQPMSFPYRWQELDQLTITVPAGFAPEAPRMPAPNKGEVLSHVVKLAYDAPRHTLHVRREFLSDVAELPVKLYPAVKGWYDAVANADRHEVVFRAGAEAPPPGTAATAKETPPKP